MCLELRKEGNEQRRRQGPEARLAGYKAWRAAWDGPNSEGDKKPWWGRGQGTDRATETPPSLPGAAWSPPAPQELARTDRTLRLDGGAGLPRTPGRWKDGIKERGVQKPLEAGVFFVPLCAEAARVALLEESDVRLSEDLLHPCPGCLVTQQA